MSLSLHRCENRVAKRRLKRGRATDLLPGMRTRGICRHRSRHDLSAWPWRARLEREFVILRLQFARKADRTSKALRLAGGPMVGRSGTMNLWRMDCPTNHQRPLRLVETFAAQPRRVGVARQGCAGVCILEITIRQKMMGPGRHGRADGWSVRPR